MKNLSSTSWTTLSFYRHDGSGINKLAGCWDTVCAKENKKSNEIGSFVSLNKNGILLPKLFGPTVRKNFSSDREKLLKFGAVGREFAKFLRSLEQFI